MDNASKAADRPVAPIPEHVAPRPASPKHEAPKPAPDGLDDALDDALADSFPASDPPATSVPTTPSKPNHGAPS